MEGVNDTIRLFEQAADELISAHENYQRVVEETGADQIQQEPEMPPAFESYADYVAHHQEIERFRQERQQIMQRLLEAGQAKVGPSQRLRGMLPKGTWIRRGDYAIGAPSTASANQDIQVVPWSDNLPVL